MKYRQFLIVMICMVIINSFAYLAPPILIQIWNNDSIGFTSERVIWLFVVLLLALIIEIIFTAIREKFAKGFNIKNCVMMLNSMFHLKYDEINEKGPMNLIERIAISVNSFYAYYTGDAIKIWSSLIIITSITVMVFLMNPYIAIILVIIVPINYFGYRLLNKELMKRSKNMQESTSSGWQEILSIVNQTDYLKQLPDYERLFEQFDSSLKKIYGSMADVNIYAQSSSTLLKSMNSIVNIMVMVFLVMDYMKLNQNPMILVIYTIILPLFFNQVNQLTSSNLNKRDMVNSKKFVEELKQHRELDGSIDIESIDTVDLQIDKLMIKDRVLSKNINGSYKKGDIIWIKGSSGAGKSTLLKLIPKFRESEGVKLNKEGIINITNKSIRSNVEYLSQNVPIIKGTLRDNLFLGKERLLEIENDLIKDPILETIFKNINLDTVILEGGTNLSGGEKQKIAIVRALYNHSDVLILDEITSNIDKESANDILNRIIDDSSNRITFIITHDDLSDRYYNTVLNL